ncbi:MAG: thiolase family protein [Sporichthyaceae bacterium]
MSDAWIAGTGITPFGRTDRSLPDLAAAAVAEALADAGLQPREVGLVLFGNAAAGLLQGQEMIRGQVALAGTGLLGVGIVNVENACASASSALFLAVQAVAGGMDVVLAVGAEKLTVGGNLRAFGALASATDTIRLPEMRALVGQTTLGIVPEGGPVDVSSSPLMEHYAAKSAEYLKASGGEVADLARVVVKSRAGAAHNPIAQFRAPTTIDEVLAARSISDPLTLPMCSPIGDGAAAVVVVSERVARRLGATVKVRACSLVSHEPGNGTPAAHAARIAYERAGVGPADIDVAEVHDAAAGAELWLLEDLGLHSPDGVIADLRSGRTSLGGATPVNAGGGLLSRGHPVGATGTAQISELADRLRGRSGGRQVPARLALAQNGGGVFHGEEAVVVVTVLEAVGG